MRFEIGTGMPATRLPNSRPGKDNTVDERKLLAGQTAQVVNSWAPDSTRFAYVSCPTPHPAEITGIDAVREEHRPAHPVSDPKCTPSR